MRIAFDLDGTLIPAPGSPMLVERPNVLARAISREPLRAGTLNLLRGLRREGHEVWIYTTSLRNPMRLSAWFGTGGVRLDGIINQARHDAAMREGSIPASCSKYPPAFGIDWLVDDARGVQIEGERLGFSVLLIEAHDTAWCSRVRSLLRNNNASGC